MVHSPICVRCWSMTRIGGRGRRNLGSLGLSLLSPFLLPSPLLPTIELLQHGLQPRALAIKHDLQLLSLGRPNHNAKLFAIRSLYTLLSFFMVLISYK